MFTISQVFFQEQKLTAKLLRIDKSSNRFAMTHGSQSSNHTKSTLAELSSPIETVTLFSSAYMYRV